MDLKTRLSRLQSRSTRPAQATAVNRGLRERLAQLRPQRLQPAPPTTAAAWPAEDLAGALDGEAVADGVIRIQKRPEGTGVRVLVLEAHGAGGCDCTA